MWEKLQFYVKHSLNDLRVNGQRTLFALLCIAAGVAAIVSLQTLAVMIESTLTGNLQESNRGDIQFEPSVELLEAEDSLQEGLDSGFLLDDSQFFFGQRIPTYLVGAAGFDQLQAWIDDHYPGQIAFTYRQPLTDIFGLLFGGGTGAALTNPETGEQVSQLSPVVVDTAVYPFYGEIVTLDGAALADVMQEPTDLVLDEDTARGLGVTVGDAVRVSGSDAEFTVRGLVATEAEVKNPAGPDVFAALFGFYYLDHSAMALFDDVAVGSDRVFLQIDESLDVVEVNAALTAAFPFVRTETTEDLRGDYEALAANIEQLVSVMGLVSLLIGSIGIINTMQVIVRRRAVEVAVLKTVGLQASEVTVLFLIEALIMGLIGSVAGIALGWAATFFIRGAAETLFATTMPFVLAPLPAINGLVVGTLVTVIFGFLPTLTAGQVRPVTVLRPSDTIIPRAGLLRSLGALIVVILALALVAQSILGNFSTALQVTVAAFIAAGVLYGLLSLLIWLIGRLFPPLGIVDLKISLRQMLAGRRRAATTLLALVVGVFSLSLITLMADSISGLLEYALSEGTGGNLLITVASAAQVGQVEDILNEMDGVHRYDVLESYTLNLVAMQEADGTAVSLDDLSERLESPDGLRVEFGGQFGGDDEGDFRLNQLELLQSELGGVGARTPDQVAAMEDVVFLEGRQLTAADSGQPVLVITESSRTRAAGIGLGDRLTFAFVENGGMPGFGSLGGSESDETAETITFEIVGVIRQPTVTMSGGGFSPTYALADAFPPDRPPTSITIIADVAEEQAPILRRELGAVPGAFALDTAVINQLLASLLGTFTAFPTMVAALGLIVGGVVIANSVALTTMERRHEIAIMKAVGLQRERVLLMLLLENGILGLIGGLIGVGIGLAALILMVASVGAPGSTLPYGTALLLMLLCVIVALIAAMTTAWGASGEKPLHVLRYE